MKYLLSFVITVLLIGSCKEKKQPYTQADFAIDQGEKNDPVFPFPKEEGWKNVYEFANTIHVVAESDMKNYDKSETSGDVELMNERSRFKIKTQGLDFSLQMILLKQNANGQFDAFKKYEINQEEARDFDLDVLNGIYRVKVKYNTVETVFRFVWEIEEK